MNGNGIISKWTEMFRTEINFVHVKKTVFVTKLAHVNHENNLFVGNIKKTLYFIV